MVLATRAVVGTATENVEVACELGDHGFGLVLRTTTEEIALYVRMSVSPARISEPWQC